MVLLSTNGRGALVGSYYKLPSVGSHPQTTHPRAGLPIGWPTVDSGACCLSGPGPARWGLCRRYAILLLLLIPKSSLYLLSRIMTVTDRQGWGRGDLRLRALAPKHLVG
eukprot:1191682-Prorocentrum_minimum.AAC.1